MLMGLLEKAQMLNGILTNKLLFLAIGFLVQGFGLLLVGEYTTARMRFWVAGLGEALLGLSLLFDSSSGLMLVVGRIVLGCVLIYLGAFIGYGDWRFTESALAEIRAGSIRRNSSELMAYLALGCIAWGATQLCLMSSRAINVWTGVVAISFIWLWDTRVAYGLRTHDVAYRFVLWFIRVLCGVALYLSVFQ